MAQLSIYATKSDYLSLNQPTWEGAVFISPRSSARRVPPRIESIRAIPRLGLARHRSAAANDSFIIYARTTTLIGYRIGSGEFVFNQRFNQDTLLFSPGGRWKKEAIVEGRFSTISRSPLGQSLYRAARRMLAKQFAKIGRYYVGPEAFTLYRAGYRLTQSIQADREHDFRPDGL